jgi:hypothetical protein
MSGAQAQIHHVLENVKVKVTELVEKVPMVDEQLTKLSRKLKTDKAYIAMGGIGISLLLLLTLGSGNFAV